ncbi:hypothetical protein CDL15_Pgr010452 [Punica granatum]|uniref:Uncharacterized protein n=1 Tax=Punica granatum TaxID=22663 RepID=A0A218VVU9_PUNGR|nr:hypothetical protein CDL15_Pgr010452 [Punica granatum]
MLDVPHRLLGGDGSIVVFTRDAPFACKCCRKVALLWIDSALGTVTNLVLVKSENCGWFTLKGADLPNVGIAIEEFMQLGGIWPYCNGGWLLIYLRSATPLGWLLFALPDADPAAEAIVAHWGCPGRMMRDSSSGVERLRIPRG